LFLNRPLPSAIFRKNEGGDLALGFGFDYSQDFLEKKQFEDLFFLSFFSKKF
jgi:hypothetical protein